MRTVLGSSVIAAAVLAAVVGIATQVGAGGFGIDLKVDRDGYVADHHGFVKLKVTLRFDGCIPFANLPPDPRQAGPRIGMERLEGDRWEVVESPWRIETECKGGEACTCHGRCPCGASCVGAGVSPACRCDPEWARPVRIERECEIAFARRAVLKPGTYRLTIDASNPQINDGKPIRFESEPFRVEGGPGKA